MDIAHLSDHLRLVEEGWYARDITEPISYPEGGHAGCYALEEASFWFAHRNQVLCELLRAFPPPGMLMDIGGGNGAVSRALLDAGHDVALLEPGAEGILNARHRGLPLVIHSTFEGAALRDESLPAAGMFDVLEHIEDERGCLDGLHRILMPKGRLYLTVPAHRWLWSRADISAGHFRRYTLRSLRKALKTSGFEVERISHFFSFLTAPIFAMRALPHLLRPDHAPPPSRATAEHQPNPIARRAVDALGAAERLALRKNQTLRMGSSILAVARKR